MDFEPIAHKQEILAALLRRKHEREVQAAQLGVNADPIIRTEIADLEREIQRIEEELQFGENDRRPDRPKIMTPEATAYAAVLQRKGCAISVQIALLILLSFVPVTFTPRSTVQPSTPSEVERILRARFGEAVMDYTWFYILLGVYAAVLFAYLFILWYRYKR